MPAVLWFPRGKRKNLTATLLVHPEGKEALEEPGASWVQPLLAQGHLVMSIDAFNTGAARARRDMSDPFFTTYNRTDDSHRVQDILTAIVYLESRPDVARVNLAGVGKGGLWCLLARGFAPELHRTLVDVSRFSSEEDQAYLEHLRSGAETGRGLQDRLHGGAGHPAVDPQHGRVLRYRLVSAGL